jgi:hypothetical protein
MRDKGSSGLADESEKSILKAIGRLCQTGVFVELKARHPGGGLLSIVTSKTRQRGNYTASS